MAKCEAQDCNRKSVAKKLCDKHYRRFIKYGSPYIIKRIYNGTALKFFNDSLKLETDDCIDWIYCINSMGYGQLRINGKTYYTHRLSLESRIGKSEDSRPHCLHSCHNTLCFNYRHLRWGTPVENMQDKIKDGTTNRGSRQWNSILNEDDIINIRKDNRKHKYIADEYKVCASNISNIKNNKSWRWL